MFIECQCESWVRIDGGRKMRDTPGAVELAYRAVAEGLPVEFYSETGPIIYNYDIEGPSVVCVTCNPAAAEHLQPTKETA